ncbi:hypothetical protein KFU94_64225 [Chloroflexi bacterium TSY]|nr:hypothetical protein [Chloroflexi bacterium TSY]
MSQFRWSSMPQVAVATTTGLIAVMLVILVLSPNRSPQEAAPIVALIDNDATALIVQKDRKRLAALAIGNETTLESGDEVYARYGSVRIGYTQDWDTTIRSGADVELQAFNRDRGGYQITLLVHQGETETRLSKPLGSNDQIEIRSPSASARAVGTIFTVRVDSEDSTYYAVSSGIIHVTMGSQTTEVHAGEQLQATLGQELRVESQTEQIAPAEIPKSYVIASAEGTSLFGQPHIEAQRLGLLSPSQRMFVVATTDDNDWYLLCCLEDGSFGWVQGDLVELSNGLDGIPQVPTIFAQQFLNLGGSSQNTQMEVAESPTSTKTPGTTATIETNSSTNNLDNGIQPDSSSNDQGETRRDERVENSSVAETPAESPTSTSILALTDTPTTAPTQLSTEAATATQTTATLTATATNTPRAQPEPSIQPSLPSPVVEAVDSPEIPNTPTLTAIATSVPPTVTTLEASEIKPTPTPSNTSTPTRNESSSEKRKDTPTPTAVPPTPTNTVAPTSVPTNTPIPPSDIPVPTNTPTKEPSDTPIPPSDTPVPTNIPTVVIEEPTATWTSVPTTEPTTEPTEVPTNTPIPPSDTPVPTNTPIPPTDTPLPTDTPTKEPTKPPPTDTPIVEPTVEPTEAPTKAPTPPIVSPTDTPTPTPTVVDPKQTPIGEPTAESE